MTKKMNDVRQLNYNALMVLKCLFENSDQYQHLSIKKIESLLKEKYGQGPTHNTINKILHHLSDYGFDVHKGDGRNPGFYLNSRFFTNGEVLFLIESLKKTRSMNEEDKQQFISKLNRYLGPEYAGINNKNTMKAVESDKSVLEKIEIINQAIKSNHQLWFTEPEPYLVVPGDMAVVKMLMEKDGLPFGEPDTRIRSNPYRVFMKKGEAYLLYSAESEDGSLPLMQRRVSELNKLYVDHEYEIVPIYRAEDHQMVNDRLLDRTEGLYPTGNRNAMIKVQLGRCGFNVGEQHIKLSDQFRENVSFLNEDGISYALVNDIYDDAEEFFFQHPSCGQIVAPGQMVKRMKRRIGALYNEYFPDNEPIPEGRKLRRNDEPVIEHIGEER